ncbi:MAG TPA: GAF domain-containing sensor histidine kinase [Anaerolineae bacterium]|nr:GAF domain-containing sensor histidine kinase [Anaerolineae bacterium]
MDNPREAMYRQRIQDMEAHISNLERLLRMMEVVNSTLDLPQLLDIIAEVAAQLTYTASASVLLIDEETKELRFVAVTGQHSASLKPVVVPMDGSIAGTVARENRPLLIRDVRADPRWYQHADRASGFETQSIIAVPLQLHGEVIGVVEAVNKQDGTEMSWDDVEILSTLATQAAVAVNNARLLSQLQAAYDELNELVRMKSEFIAVAAHELRTPLSLILGYSAFLRANASGLAREQADVVLQSAMRLRSLIDDMANLREVDAGEAVLRLEAVPMQELVELSVEEMRHVAEAKQQRIHLSMPDSPVLVEADRDKITLALVNLLSNAVKFTPSGRRVGVRVGSARGEAWATVWDTGIGISQDQQARVFDRFYQAECSLTRQYGGMGLGLSIVKEMVDLHHGSVSLESQPGKGSAFTIRIPVYQTAREC